VLDRIWIARIGNVQQPVGKDADLSRQRVWPRDYAAQGAGDDAQ